MPFFSSVGGNSDSRHLCIPTNHPPMKPPLFTNRHLGIFLPFLSFRVFRDSEKKKSIGNRSSNQRYECLWAFPAYRRGISLILKNPPLIDKGINRAIRVIRDNPRFRQKQDGWEPEVPPTEEAPDNRLPTADR